MVDTLDALQKAYQQGKRYKFIFFWKPTPPADGSINQSCLGQWWMQPFTVEGVVYSCAEQYMMAQKALLFGDREVHAQIMEAHSPKEMKALGRKVSNFEQGKWDSRCLDIVMEANRAKFSQNPALLDYLRSTKGRILVEASPLDRIWGIGMGESNPDAQNPMKWRGKNRLGFALTNVREALIEKV